MTPQMRLIHSSALRYALYALLALTTYSLILAWGARSEQIEKAQATVQQQAMTEMLQMSASQADVVRIQTDVLQLAVQRTGGDIIEASLMQYPVSTHNHNPLPLLLNTPERFYIAQSGLGGRDGFDVRTRSRPEYQVQQSEYVIDSDTGSIEIPMQFSKNGISVTKTYTLNQGSYLIQVRHRVVNRSGAPIYLRQFGTLRRDSLAPLEGDSQGLGLAGYVGGATTSPEELYLKLDFDDIEQIPYVREQALGGWIAVLQRYFLSAWIPDPDGEYNYRARRLGGEAENARYQYGFASAEEVRIDEGEEHTFSANLYLGPKIYGNLKQLAPNLELAVDYGWLFFIGEPLFLLLQWLHDYTDNWGWAIVLLTLTVKVAFFWLSNAGYRSTSRMRLLSPMLTELRERFPDDRQKQMQESMALYRRHKINPLGGCLPLLIPMPIFIALYWVLIESVELRQAHFALWISDLSSPDPYYALPLLMGASMLVMQQLSPPPPNLDPMQARMLKFMPVAFTLFFLWFPAGLVLYWLINNMFSMTHQYIVNQNTQRKGL
ncbi:MAG: membrane protein insertase YidC [Gammaproteobacteria bacterium AqS3]|nr:membrane protein insertase YidC [Gammaproteobacteria bacterium AqS3]